MDFSSLFVLALGLAMDAFAVAITIGMKISTKEKMKIAFKTGIFFGVAQGTMPFIGWLLGYNFKSYIEGFDHWIAFVLLGILGGKMIYESIKGDDEDEKVDTGNKKMFILAIATSIDALAVGISFAFLNVNIVSAVLFIGILTLVTSFIGVLIGKKFGQLFEGKAEFIGGVILILIGTKILLEHTGLLEKILG